jgi:hypothetical protein
MSKSHPVVFSFGGAEYHLTLHASRRVSTCRFEPWETCARWDSERTKGGTAMYEASPYYTLACLDRVCRCYGQGPLVCACRHGCGCNQRRVLSLYVFRHVFDRIIAGKLCWLHAEARFRFQDVGVGCHVRLVCTDRRVAVVRVTDWDGFRDRKPDALIGIELTRDPPPTEPLMDWVLERVQDQERLSRRDSVSEWAAV